MLLLIGGLCTFSGAFCTFSVKHCSPPGGKYTLVELGEGRELDESIKGFLRASIYDLSMHQTLAFQNRSMGEFSSP